jgi:putative hemolysin
MDDLTGPILGLVVLLILSGFFSSAETALMSVSRYRLRYLERQGNPRAIVLRKLLADPDRLLSAILLGNNFVNIAASALATAIAIEVAGDNGVLAATLIMTATILIFSEIAPKSVAARKPEWLALAIAPAVGGVVWLLHPFAAAAAFAASLFTWPLLGREPVAPRISEEEIQGMLQLGEEEHVIAREKGRMLSSIFRLTETTIEDVMIPRTQINALALDASPADIIATIRGSGATRLPVFDDNLDDIVGVIHSKDVFEYWDRIDELDVAKIMRRPLYIPETATLETLLRMLRHHRQHLAVVIDEFGGVEGIVSLEDLLEEIVGEIEDEHDVPRSPQMMEMEDGSLLVEGTCPISLLNRRYQLGLEAEDSTTLAGLVMEISGEIPRPGTRIEHGDLTFNVRRASPNRIDLIRIDGYMGAD